MSDWKEELAVAAVTGELLQDSRRNIELFLEETDDERAEAAIAELVQGEEWEELNDRFYKTMSFGTGGFRGRTIGRIVARVELGKGAERARPELPCFGTAAMNFYNVSRAMRGFITYVKRDLAKNGKAHQPAFVIACDTRHFSEDFARHCAEICAELGCEAYLFDGPRATPELSFALRELRADAGVVLTASHNPPHDNGFKAYFRDGGQIVEPHASGIIAEVNALGSESDDPLPADKRGVVHIIGEEMDRKYMDKLRTVLLRPDLLEKRPARLVYTNLHGTGGWIIVPMLRELGVEVTTVEGQDEQDGDFSTVNSPNPENASALQMAIDLACETGAEAAIGTDPDCDRMGVAVRNAAGEMQLLSGNQLGTLMAWYRIKTFFEQGIISESNRSRATLVKTFVTSEFQAAVARRFGIGVVNTLTGFKYIGEKLRKYEETIPVDKRGDYRALGEKEKRTLQLEYSRFLVFGGEESYGYLGCDFVRDKDGNGAVVMFAELAAFAKSEGKKITDLLDELYHEFGVHDELNTSIVLEGAGGAARIAALSRSYSENPPSELAGVAVGKVRDFSREDIYDEEGDLVPKTGMLLVDLEDGRRFAVRPSGTEPKIKYYLFGRGAPGAADLAASKKAVRDGLGDLWHSLRMDAHQRMEAEP